MRTALLLFLTSAFAYGQLPVTTKTAKIEEIFRLTKTDQLQKQIMTQMSAMMQKQVAGDLTEQERTAAAGVMDKVMALVSEKMSWDQMKPEFIKLYDETFTENEISGILLFYQSDAGHAMLEKMPALMTNAMALPQKRMIEIKPEMDKIIRESHKN